jgi:hypothetical protein
MYMYIRIHMYIHIYLDVYTYIPIYTEEFTKINMKIEETGNFDSLDKISLYKMVASNNIIIINVLSKLVSHMYFE